MAPRGRDRALIRPIPKAILTRFKGDELDYCKGYFPTQKYRVTVIITNSNRSAESLSGSHCARRGVSSKRVIVTVLFPGFSVGGGCRVSCHKIDTLRWYTPQ